MNAKAARAEMGRVPTVYPDIIASAILDSMESIAKMVCSVASTIFVFTCNFHSCFVFALNGVIQEL